MICALPRLVPRLNPAPTLNNKMSIEYLKALLANTEEMLAMAGTLPDGAGRDQALQMVKDYIFDIERLMNAIELALKAGM
jgi:hypothetical protein